MVDNAEKMKNVRKRLKELSEERERKIKKEKPKGFYRDEKGKPSPDGFQIHTGLVMLGIRGEPEPVYEWNRDIPYEKFKNEHTKEQVTAEQIEAVKYFVNEYINDCTKVFGYKYSEKDIDGMIRSKLLKAGGLPKQVEEYKKEMSDKDYQSVRRQARFAEQVKEYKILHGKNYVE